MTRLLFFIVHEFTPIFAKSFDTGRDDASTSTSSRFTRSVSAQRGGATRPSGSGYSRSLRTSEMEFKTSPARTEAVVPRSSAAYRPAWAWIHAPATAAS